MLSELLAILAPIMISVGAGFIWGKTGTEFPSDFISRIVMNIGTRYCYRYDRYGFIWLGVIALDET
jgi:hypothetical protein